MKFKKWVEKYAKEILISVIVSLVTAGVIKGIDWIRKIAPTAGNSIWSFFSNSFITKSARITETSLISLLFVALLGIAVAYVFYIMTNVLRQTKKTIKDADDIIEDINNPITKNSKEKNKITTKEVKTEAKNIIRETKRMRRVTLAAIVFFVLYFGNILLFDILPHILWTEYQRDLVKIAPYIEEQELTMIKSDWVCMQNKEDYDEVYNRINKVKDENGLP